MNTSSSIFKPRNDLMTPLKLVQSIESTDQVAHVQQYSSQIQCQRSNPKNMSPGSQGLQSDRTKSIEPQIDQLSVHLNNNPYTLSYESTTPMQIHCSRCDTFNSSYVIFEQTKYTYYSSLLLMLVLFCWVPFVFKSKFQKVKHYCPQCDIIIGQYDYLESLFNE